VWLYHRFALSLRDVQELMVARGVVVSYETIRSWCAKFGPNYGNRLRRRRARPGDKWHLDEVFVRIRGPRVVVRDKLASYQVAAREVLPSVIHRRWKYLNNRAENSHQPTRIREWVMKRFASPGQAQRFLFAFSHVREQFRPRGHLMSAPQWRTEMNDRFAVWDEIITTEAA
jgi:putative transposase